MVKCWAAALGGCNNIQSREHLVSAGVFDGQVVQVKGRLWHTETLKPIGINSLTANILCKHHNSTLSPVDDAGIHAFGTFTEVARLSSVRGKIHKRYWQVKRYEIDGKALERWFLKTLINLYLESGKHPWSHTGSPVKAPPQEFVEVVFGKRVLVEPMGLYGVGRDGQVTESISEVVFHPLYNNANPSLGGAFFEFRGFRFLLWLYNERVPPIINITEELHREWRNPKLTYHSPKLWLWEMKGKSPSQVVAFKW